MMILQSIGARTFRLVLLTAAAGLTIAQQRQPSPSQVQTQILEAYFKRLEELSEPPAERWKHFGHVYFESNESLLNPCYSRFDGKGGVLIAVGLQQPLSLLAHVQPGVTVTLDFNPAVPEIAMPFLGELMVESPTRREFVSRISGVELVDQEMKEILEPHRQPGQTLADLKMYLAVNIPRILGKIPETQRQANLARLKTVYEKYVNRTPESRMRRKELLQQFDDLQADIYQSQSGWNFFFDAAAASWMADTREQLDKLAGWLSTEKNYRLARNQWVGMHVVGVAGDVTGPSIEKINQWLRAKDSLGPAEARVTSAYLSDVGIYHGEGQTFLARMYHNLARLPWSGDALTLIAHGTNTAYVRSFRLALWEVDYLVTDDSYVQIALINAPLESVTLDGQRSLFPKLKQKLAEVLRNKGLYDQAASAAAQSVVAQYDQLFKEVSSSAASLATLNPAAFENWVQQRLPGLDTRTDYFRAITITLVETGYLRPPRGI